MAAERNYRREILSALKSGDADLLADLALQLASKIDAFESRSRAAADRKRRQRGGDTPGQPVTSRDNPGQSDGPEPSTEPPADVSDTTGPAVTSRDNAARPADREDPPSPLPSRSFPTPLSNSSFSPSPASPTAPVVEKSAGIVEIAPVHLGRTAGERSLAIRLLSDADRLALTAILARVPAPTTVVAELNACLDSMPGHAALTPERLGFALREFTGNGGLEGWNFTNFRRYLQRAASRQEPGADGGSGESGANGSPRAGKPVTGPDLAGEAGHVLAKIKRLKQTVSAQAGGQTAFIRRSDVEAIGTDVLSAYDAVGGGEAILKGDPSKWGLLVRDFANSLAFARNEAAKPAGVETSKAVV